MKVKELIKILEGFDPDTTIGAYSHYTISGDISEEFDLTLARKEDGAFVEIQWDSANGRA